MKRLILFSILLTGSNFVFGMDGAGAVDDHSKEVASLIQEDYRSLPWEKEQEKEVARLITILEEGGSFLNCLFKDGKSPLDRANNLKDRSLYTELKKKGALTGIEIKAASINDTIAVQLKDDNFDPRFAESAKLDTRDTRPIFREIRQRLLDQKYKFNIIDTEKTITNFIENPVLLTIKENKEKAENIVFNAEIQAMFPGLKVNPGLIDQLRKLGITNGEDRRGPKMTYGEGLRYKFG